MSVFDGRDPNGTWELYVLEPAPGATGAITDGWTLGFELGDADPQTGAAAGGQATGPGGVGSPDASGFSNDAAIQIPSDGKATPYPSTIEVSNLDGVVTDANVTLNGFGDAFPPGVDLLLVAPGGQSVLLMEGVGGPDAADGLAVTFDDAGSALTEGDPITSGTFRPSSNAGDGFGFNGPPPAAPQPHGSALAVLNGTDPNGTWSLFAFGDSGGGTGQISGGWSLDLEIGTPAEMVFSDDFSLTDSGWDVFDESGTFGVYRDGVYAIGVQGGFQTASVLNTSQPESSDLEDVRVEATTRFHGNPDAIAGVICRAVSGERFYYFSIQGDGTAYIGENDPDDPNGFHNFVSAFTPAVVRGEAPNRVAGECVGGSEGVTLRMFVNGIAVDTVIDGVDPILAGTFGVRAESRQEPAEVEFDDFLVTRAS